MSWSHGMKVVSADGIPVMIEAYLGEHHELDPEAIEQVQVAGRLAHDLIASGVLGKGTFSVNLNGHANPGHTTRAGYANDATTVAIHVVDYAEETPDQEGAVA